MADADYRDGRAEGVDDLEDVAGVVEPACCVMCKSSGFMRFAPCPPLSWSNEGREKGDERGQDRKRELTVVAKLGLVQLARVALVCGVGNDDAPYPEALLLGHNVELLPQRLVQLLHAARLPISTVSSPFPSMFPLALVTPVFSR